MMIKWSVHWEALTFISIHVPNRAPKTSKNKLREKWILFGEFNTLLSIMDTTSRKRNRRLTKLKQLDLIGIYRTQHPLTTEYTFFSNAH